MQHWSISLPLKCLKTAGGVANSVDPDQMPHSVSSNPGLHCLPDLSVPVLRVIMVPSNFSLIRIYLESSMEINILQKTLASEDLCKVFSHHISPTAHCYLKYGNKPLVMFFAIFYLDNNYIYKNLATPIIKGTLPSM